MEHTLVALIRNVGAQARVPVKWSNSLCDRLRRVARREEPSPSVIDPELAPLLLKCAEGDFDEVEISIVDLLRCHLDKAFADTEVFISLLHALFVVQRFDLMAAMLRDRYDFPRDLEVGVESEGGACGQVAWTILPSGGHRFIFNTGAFSDDNTRNELLAFQWEFPVYANYARQEIQEIGTVMINQQDIGQTPGLAFCDNKPNFFLIPDCSFVPSRGHEHVRLHFRASHVPWYDRQPIAFWRGATTGVPRIPGDWRSLERIHLCELARRYEQTGLIDAGISEVKQFSDESVRHDIQNSGLMRGFVPWQDWNKYKILIEIDGNCNSWSNLFQRLLTGSPVLRVESSRGLNQWFYDELIPWKNYIPVAPDMSDLMSKISWLIKNDGEAQRIGRAGLALAEHLTYEREIDRSVPTISAAFRYFNGKPEGVGPFGRVVGDNRPI